MSTECVFCAIVEGTEPAEVIYEDAHAIAFLDIAPATEGHTLVIPRRHSVDLFDIGSEVAAHVMRASIEVAAMLKAALGVEAMNVVHASGRDAWQHIFHFHLHLIPRRDIGELTPPWPLNQQSAEPARLSEVAARIRASALG